MKKNILKRFWHRFFKGEKRLINGSKGVISLFLAILMVPFASIAASLINAARINSAVAVFDEALCNASNSTLGTYDEFLRKRFGLLAIKEQNGGATAEDVQGFIQDTFDIYMEENGYSLSNTFFDMDTDAEGMFPLADKSVLLSEILEYSKYSVPTKTVEDAIDIDNLIAQLEKAIDNMFPCSSILNALNNTAKKADQLITLGQDVEALENAIVTQQEKENAYNIAYSEFQSAVNDYVQKKNDGQREIEELEEKIRKAKQKVDSIDEDIEDIKEEIDDLWDEMEENEDVDNSDEIDRLEDRLDDLRKERSEANSDLSKAKSEKTAAEARIKAELAEAEAAVNEKKSAYASKIGEYSEAVGDAGEKAGSVQEDLMTITGKDSLIDDYFDAKKDEAKEDRDKAKQAIKESNDIQIAKIDEQIAKASSEKEKKALENKKKAFEKETADSATIIKNIGTIEDAANDAYAEGLNSVNDAVKDVSKSAVNSVTNGLNTLQSDVEGFDVKKLSNPLEDAEYYRPPSALLSKEELEHAVEDALRELASESIWGIIKAIVGFFKAIFTVFAVYDSHLAAVIDVSYYENNNGGFQSKKKVSYDSEHKEADAAMSAAYKELLGDFALEYTDADDGIDLIETLKGIIVGIGNLSKAIADLGNPTKLLEFANNLQKIVTEAQNVIKNVNDVFAFLKNLFSPENIYKKLLLTGYISYMLSDRMTYDGSALTGEKFNLRGQTGADNDADLPLISDMAALVETIKDSIGGGSDKCFVGAEKEYLFFGSNKEIANQTAVFGFIYLLRLVLDIGPVLTNGEVASMATAATIAAPLVYLLVVLIEPLIDTFILTAQGGQKIPLIKTSVFLTPSGLSNLIGHVTTLELTEDELNKQKEHLAGAFGSEKYAEVQAAFPSENDTTEGILPVDYSTLLFLMMFVFTPKNKLLSRTADIIEMESVENLQNNGGGEIFNLDYSYTYIRAEGAFSTNMFIPIKEMSENVSIKKRLIYKGY